MKYIKTEELKRNNRDHLLDFDKYFYVGDLIKTTQWEKKCWFFFSINDKNIDEGNSMELYNYYNSKLIKVTNRYFYKMISDVNSDIKIIKDRMIVIQDFELVSKKEINRQ